jgi:hypothetical protein
VLLRSRLRAVVLLLALAPVELVTVGAALGADPSCCGTTMCMHHHGGMGAPGPAKVAATPVAAPAAAAATHCAHHAAPVPNDCSMRGCDQQRDPLLPLSPLAFLPLSTSVARPEGVSSLTLAAARTLLDRAVAVEPPPPRSLPV